MPADENARFNSPSAWLWTCLDDSVAHSTALTALCGVPARHVDDVITLFVAQSDDVEDFLAHVPAMLRHLAHKSTTAAERCVGQVRGPILWAETVACWSTGLGMEDVFVCGAPSRDFDVPENRLVVRLLHRIALAARRADGPCRQWFDRAGLAKVDANAQVARQLLEHRALRGIDGRRFSSRDLRRVVTGRNSATYELAVDLHAQMLRPFDGDEIEDTCDEATLEEHRVIGLIQDALRNRGQAVPLLSVRDGAICSGRLQYRCASNTVDPEATGVRFGPVLVHTRARKAVARGGAVTGSRAVDLWTPTCYVTNSEDAERLVDAILTEDQSTSGFTQSFGSYSSSSSSLSPGTEVPASTPGTGESLRIDS